MPGERRHHANPRVIGHARAMRHDAVPAEQKLWWKLRDRRLGGFKFRRQQPTGPFVADFYCPDCRLIVELDGDTHDGREEYDAERTRWLNDHGVEVIRFTNTDVHDNLDGVLKSILKKCESRSPATNAMAPTSLSPCGRGRG